MGETGKSWRTRNNAIATHSDFKPKTRLITQTHSRGLVESLREDKHVTNMTKSMIKSLKTEASCIDRAPALVKGIQKLK